MFSEVNVLSSPKDLHIGRKDLLHSPKCHQEAEADRVPLLVVRGRDLDPDRDAENIPGRLCPLAAGTLAIAKTPTPASVSASLDSASTPRRENLRPSSASLDRWRR